MKLLATESTICRETEQQLISLQDWITQQNELKHTRLVSSGSSTGKLNSNTH